MAHVRILLLIDAVRAPGAVLARLRPDWLWIWLSGVLFLATYAVLIETWREVLRSWQKL